jgi:hypothetical protein
MKVFFINSLGDTLQIHMFNISPLLNKPKIEKKLKMGLKLMKHPLCLWEINFEEIHFYYQAVNYGSNGGYSGHPGDKILFLEL